MPLGLDFQSPVTKKGLRFPVKRQTPPDKSETVNRADPASELVQPILGRTTDKAGDEERDTLGIDNVIAALGSDLAAARKRADEKGNDAFGLYLTSAQLELQFTVSRDTSMKAGFGVKFNVVGVGGVDVDGGGTREVAKEQVQRITLNLVTKPPTPTTKPPLGFGTKQKLDALEELDVQGDPSRVAKTDDPLM